MVLLMAVNRCCREKRKKSGIGAHVVIHKYFFDRSPIWQTVVAEEAEAAEVDLLKAELDAEDDVGLDTSKADVTFEPLDLHHLSSLPILRARVVKLLLASPHQMHALNNLMARVVSIIYTNSSSLALNEFAI